MKTRSKLKPTLKSCHFMTLPSILVKLSVGSNFLSMMVWELLISCGRENVW